MGRMLNRLQKGFDQNQTLDGSADREPPRARNIIALVLPEQIKTTCPQCNLRELCLPYNLSEEDLDRLSSLVGSHRKLKRGHYLYRAGSPFDSLFAIKTGFFKTDVLLDDGREQATGFQMAGELLGLDGIANEVHTCNAVAQEDSEVCVIQFAHLERLSHEVHALQRHLHKVMSREIARDHGVMALLGTMRAEERLAAFLLNLGQRFAARGYSAREFYLRMTREEIGSYLGLKLETVSRAFSRFQEEGYIDVHQKHIRIVEPERLRKLLNH